ETRRQHTARIETRIDMLHAPRAANQQAGADEQRDRKRNFRRDEDSTQPIARKRSALASSFAKRALHLRPHSVPGRKEPKADGASDADRQREEKDAPIDACLLETRDALRAHGDDDA